VFILINKLEIIDIQAIVTGRLEDKLPKLLSLGSTSNLDMGAE
jgi:hypothetical protein